MSSSNQKEILLSGTPAKRDEKEQWRMWWKIKWELIKPQSKRRKQFMVMNDAEAALDLMQECWGQCCGAEAAKPMSIVQWCSFLLDYNKDDNLRGICLNALNNMQRGWDGLHSKEERWTERDLDGWCNHLIHLDKETLLATRREISLEEQLDKFDKTET